MDPYYSTKKFLKIVRWRARRAAAAIAWGARDLRKSPVVLGNAMPKSGSHLIIQVLQGLTRVGPFVNPGFPPVNRNEENERLAEDDILANIQRMRPGDIAYGYIPASEPYVSALNAPGGATIFVSRDPRDMIISHVFYATQIHTGHAMHRYYTETLKTMEERINAAIEGVEAPGSQMSSVLKRYQAYLGWLDQRDVLNLRFEDLIQDRDASIRRILAYLRERGAILKLPEAEAVELVKSAIQPRRSGTFRKGQPGNWREHFTPANIALFKELTGDLIISLGYETTSNWL